MRKTKSDWNIIHIIKVTARLSSHRSFCICLPPFFLRPDFHWKRDSKICNLSFFFNYIQTPSSKFFILVIPTLIESLDVYWVHHFVINFAFMIPRGLVFFPILWNFRQRHQTAIPWICELNPLLLFSPLLLSSSLSFPAPVCVILSTYETSLNPPNPPSL